ncbi:hypothetical protein M8J77_007294 [Diaphorina citri]|nr:hypothetical protein M8J77_007294 [Diaphorina citri]
MIIKLPRNQVEIVEVIKQTEENVDVDIEGNEDKIMSDLDSKYSNPISSESPNDKNIDQNRQQIPMIIEHWNVNESDDSVEEKPNIDKITLENLNSGPYESKADKEFQYEAEDDEDIDKEWRPDNAEQSEHDSFEDEYDDNDDEWNPYGNQIPSLSPGATKSIALWGSLQVFFVFLSYKTLSLRYIILIFASTYYNTRIEDNVGIRDIRFGHIRMFIVLCCCLSLGDAAPLIFKFVKGFIAGKAIGHLLHHDHH